MSSFVQMLLFDYLQNTKMELTVKVVNHVYGTAYYDFDDEIHVFAKLNSNRPGELFLSLWYRDVWKKFRKKFTSEHYYKKHNGLLDDKR